MVAGAAVGAEVVVMNNFWLDRKNLNPDQVGFRRLITYAQKRIDYLWKEDKFKNTFSFNSKEFMDQLRRRGAFCEYELSFYENADKTATVILGVKFREECSWAYFLQELV